MPPHVDSRVFAMVVHDTNEEDQYVYADTNDHEDEDHNHWN